MALYMHARIIWGAMFMIGENKKRMVVKLDAEVYREVERYCKQSNLSEREFMDDVIHCFLNESLKMLDTMRKGYIEMAHINLEICTEFDGCETEVTSLV